MRTKAREIMKRNLVTVPREMDLRDLAKLLLEKGITGAPVEDESGNLVGVISQTDLIFYQLTRVDELVMDSDFYHNVRIEGRHLPSGFQVADFNTRTVGDLMTPVVHSVGPDDTLEMVARLMTRKHIHRVIVREGGRVLGIISALDILRSLGRKARSSKRAPARKKTAVRKTAKKRSPGKGPRRKTTSDGKRVSKKAGSRKKPGRSGGGK